MLDRTAPNPREHIGANQPPGAIELAEPTIEALRAFLADNPVVGNEDEAREAKAILDRTVAALKGIDDERKSKTDPLNAQLRELNSQYHKWHNSGSKSGIWDKLLAELRSRMTAFAREEERKRRETAEAARRAAEEAAETARQAAETEAQARDEASMGVCDIDLTGAVEEAKATSDAAMRANWAAQTAEKQSHVRIGGGFGKVATLRDREILSVTDWRAAIEDMCGSNGAPPTVIIDAILTAARAYRRENNELPAGISASYERRI